LRTKGPLAEQSRHPALLGRRLDVARLPKRWTRGRSGLDMRPPFVAGPTPCHAAFVPEGRTGRKALLRLAALGLDTRPLSSPRVLTSRQEAQPRTKGDSHVKPASSPSQPLRKPHQALLDGAIPPQLVLQTSRFHVDAFRTSSSFLVIGPTPARSKSGPGVFIDGRAGVGSIEPSPPKRRNRPKLAPACRRNRQAATLPSSTGDGFGALFAALFSHSSQARRPSRPSPFGVGYAEP
jgi:hypothetical protein